MALTAMQLVEESPQFFNRKAAASDVWKDVHLQAIDHTRRGKKTRLLEKARPNESPELLAYRQDNIRHTTKEGVDQFMTAVEIGINEGGVDIKGQSEKLTAYINSNPYFVNGQRVTWQNFFYSHVLQVALDDPNAILVDLPIIPEKPQLSPHYNNPTNQELGVKTFIVKSSEIVRKNKNIFSWVAGKEAVPGPEKQTRIMDWFYICDRFFYWTYIPISFDEDGKTTYELLEWYEHDTGFEEENDLPLNNLPAKNAIDKKCGEYLESFLRPFFEWGDEHIVRFSNGQAVDVRFAFPKTVMDPIDCTNKACNDGKVTIFNPDNTIKDVKPCHVCNGGTIKDIGPYNTLVKKEDRDGKISPGPGINYVTPDVGILAHAFKTPIDILDRAFHSVGLNLLGSVIESGEAKKVILRKKKDMVRSVTHSLFKTIFTHLVNVECIKNVSRADRVKPTIEIPRDFGENDIELLKIEAEQALAGDKFPSIMRYISNKYSKSPETIKAMRGAYTWSPLLLYLDETETLSLRLMAYSSREQKKADLAVQIFMSLTEGNDFMEAELPVLIERAEQKLNELIGPKEEEIDDRDDNGEVV